MRSLSLALLIAATVSAQTANPIVNTSKGAYAEVKGYVLRSAEKVPENLWSFKPAPDVRTFGQLVAHIADGAYEICGALAPSPVNKNIEKTVTGKTAILAALKESYAYCDAFYTNMTDANAGQIADMFGRKVSRIGVLQENISHTNLHYGNMVTYMRIKGIVPASSEPAK